MGHKAGTDRTELPAVLNPEMRLNATQARKLAGEGKSAFYRLVKQGVLPQPERTSPRHARWVAGPLLEAIRRRGGAAV